MWAPVLCMEAQGRGLQFVDRGLLRNQTGVIGWVVGGELGAGVRDWLGPPGWVFSQWRLLVSGRWSQGGNVRSGLSFVTALVMRAEIQ